ncbi:MAG TPA: hypothetical protein VIM69_06370 [Opitutaceae bacterium]
MNSVSQATVHELGVSSLWWGWLVAPTWWLTQFEVRYAFVRWACVRGQRGWIDGMGFAAVLISIVIVLWSVRCFRAAKGDEAMRFVSVGAIWISIGFAVLTAVQILPDLFIDVCRL